MYQAIWGQAHTDNHATVKAAGNTVSLSVVSPLSGKGLKVRFLNKHDKKGFTILEAIIDTKEGEKPLTFAGKTSVEMPLGKAVESDEVSLTVNKGEKIAVRFALRGASNSGNTLIEDMKISASEGNFVHDHSFKGREKTKTELKHNMEIVLPTLEEISLHTEENKRVIVCFGDSITAMCRWTRPLQDRFIRDGQEVSVINKGIGGNQLLSGPPFFIFKMFGKSGVSRFENDVLKTSGATDLIIALGTNDIVMNRRFTDELFIDTLKTLVKKAEDRGLEVYVCTIPPRGDKQFTEKLHAKRRRINEMIRKEFRYIEYAKGMALGDDLDTLDPDLALEDLLHPNDKGGLQMAEIIYEEIK